MKQVTCKIGLILGVCFYANIGYGVKVESDGNLSAWVAVTSSASMLQSCALKKVEAKNELEKKKKEIETSSHSSDVKEILNQQAVDIYNIRIKLLDEVTAAHQGIVTVEHAATLKNNTITIRIQ